MKKKIILSLLTLILIVFAIWLWNYLTLQQKMNSVINNDYRNSGVEVSVHYGSYINNNNLIYNLTSISGSNSPVDIFRVFLQFAEKVKNDKFSNVELEYRGKLKFKLSGAYFRELGREYSSQNPIYTMRKFPSNLINPDGTQAYSEWTGGLLGVLNKEMEDFNDFHKKWYMNDY